MNRFLSSSLNFINGMSAILIIIGFAWLGSEIGGSLGMAAFAILGVLAAALLCGMVATLVLIEGHLRKMAHPNARKGDSASLQRTEPIL